MAEPYPYEVEALRRLVGVPGVVQYYDYFIKKGPKGEDTLVVVMEKVKDSECLSEFTEKCGEIPEYALKLIFKQVRFFWKRKINF